jgi:release factor glutamine methyltransferase
LAEGVMIRRLLKWIIHHVIRPVVIVYLSSERNYRYNDISAVIKPGVFHPGFFFSTKLLLDYLKNIPLQNRVFLELGAGSGLISVYAAKQKAKVTASDISQTAVETAMQNADRNRVSIKAINSDMFEQIPPQIFDIIVINPPYYPQRPVNERDYAWFCGKNYEYFEKLFQELGRYADQHSNIIMILSEDCQIDRIRQIALKSHWKMEMIYQKRILWEMNFIFRIIFSQNGLYSSCLLL